MAASGQAHASMNLLPATSDRVPTSKRPLPNGPCNYRDLAFGSCGCNQFWDKCSAELHEGSTEDRSNNERSTWCVCGHHACFHQQAPRPGPDQFLAPAATSHHRMFTRCDGQCQLQPGLHCNVHRGLRPVDEEIPQVDGSKVPEGLRGSQAPSSQRLSRQRASQSQTGASGKNQQSRDASQPSASGLPKVPSICLLNSHELQPFLDVGERQVRHDINRRSYQSPAGLGLSLMNIESLGDATNRQQSVGSVEPDEVDKPIHGSYSESEIPSTQQNSIPDDKALQKSPDMQSLGRIIEFTRGLPQLEASDTIPDTYNPDDFIQSATEVATPTVVNTPDMQAADKAVEETKKIIDTLTSLASNAEASSGHLETRPSSANSGNAPKLLLSNSPATPQEQLQHVLRSASPQAIQRIVSYLNPLHNLLNSIPNVAATIRDLTARIDLLENNSFNIVQPEEINHQFESYDVRVLELENRMNDHDRLHAAIDADQSSNSIARRRVPAVTDSFCSNHSSSAQSVTSSALIVAAMDRKEIQTELDGIKNRLDTLEAAAMPTQVDPWQVEVVLLPWGQELRGIWYSPDEPMHDPTKTITQDTEEWTQARSLRSSSRSSLPFNDAESGWSSQAISDWADTTDEWLSPKACGSNNLVYKRLQSRGFIRNVTLRSANAGDIQIALSNAFDDLIEHLEYHPVSNDQHYDAVDSMVHAFPGLRASIIPLRKIMKSSRLRFLTRAEMSSSALWSAQFLASGVLMRVSGGKKRLYVTQREAYVQQSNNAEVGWTWQRLRELPRFHSDLDSQMEGNDKHCQPNVPEADAREACWTYYPACDPPISVGSSFSSSHSAPLSIRPAEKPQARRSITPTSILKNKQPISPMSEFPPRRPTHRRNRTVSASMIDDIPPSSSKRPLNPSFEHSIRNHSNIPHSQFRTVRQPSASVSKAKRRRLTVSPSPKPIMNEAQNQVVVWTSNTPRRSREPPSPFFSSHPELPRSNSDVTNRSQRSLNVIGKNTPFAYATPHSGPIIGGHAGFKEDFGGDTEPDYDDDDDDDDDGGSWHGVDDEDESESQSGTDDDDAVSGAQRPQDQASFSAEEDSGFGAEEDDDDNGDDVDFGFDTNVEDGGDDVFGEEGDDEDEGRE